MKIKAIVDARVVFAAKLNQKMHAKTAYKIARFLRDTAADEEFFRGRVKEIAEAFGEKDKNGNYVLIDKGIKIKDSAISEFKKEMNELLDVDSNVSSFQFDIVEFEEIDLSVADMMFLIDFINKEA